MFLISPLPLPISDRGIKRQQDEGDPGGSVAFSLAIWARIGWLIKQVFSEGVCVCVCVLWGVSEQVLGVNNVTGFAPRHPYRFASAVLSAFCGHKGFACRERCRCQGGGRNSPFIWSLSTLLCTPPPSLPYPSPPTPPLSLSPHHLCFSSSQRGRVQEAVDGFRKCCRLGHFYLCTAHLHIDNYFSTLHTQGIMY